MWGRYYTLRAELVRTDSLRYVLIIPNALRDRQGMAHGILNTQIRKQMNAQLAKQNGGGLYPWQPDVVVQFGLILSNKPNDHAARIRFYDYKIDDRDEKTVAKRSIENDFPTNLVSFLIILRYTDQDRMRQL
jgi:hypothetical protein